MKWLFILLSTLFLATSTSGQKQVSFEPEDQRIFTGIIEANTLLRNMSVGDIVVQVGKSFLETPYVAHTLEQEPEHLVVNLRELDCTTFAENCLAIARCIKSGNTSFDDFTRQLQFIRYRNGIINGYPSRLHYFSDWIFDNNQKNTVKTVSKQISNIPYPLNVNFMSTHPSSYRQLTDNPDFVQEMQEKEAEISARKMYYIPKNKLKIFESKLMDGDIVGLCTTVAGLDMTHVGILVRKNGRVHLLHASSKAEKVILSDGTLEDYLNGRSSISGIMVARPN